MATYISDGTTIPHATDHDDMLNILLSFLRGGTPAEGTLTLTGNIANTETVTIDAKTYTFQTTLTNVDGNVLIGATASDTIDNFIAAINLDTGAGISYAAVMTVHPTVFANIGTGDTMIVSTKTAGTGGNSIASTETSTNASWGGATLSGGSAVGNLPSTQQWVLLKDDSSSVANERFVYLRGPGVPANGILTLTGNALNTETVTIDAKTYTFQTTLTNVDGNVFIGATASDTIDNLVAAINLEAGAGTLYAAATTIHPTVSATDGVGDSMNAFAKTAGTVGNSIATTEALTNGSWQASTLLNGLDGTAHVNIRRFSDEPTDSRNWQLKSAIDFDGSENFDNQPGTSSIQTYFTMTDNTSMPFWIVANDRRFIVVAQSLAVWCACYGGFYLPFHTPSELPFPIFIGGNSTIFNIPVTNTSYRIGNFYDGPINCGQTRHSDGNWLATGSFQSTSAGSRPTSDITDNTLIFPWDSNTGNDYLLLDNEGGDWTLFQNILYSSSNSGNVYGELQGVYFLPSRNGFTGNIITINSEDYLVIQNTYRSSEVNAAIKLV